MTGPGSALPVELIVATLVRSTSCAAGLPVLPTPFGTMPTWPNLVSTRPVIVMSEPITPAGLAALRRMPATNRALDVVAAGSRVASWIQMPESALKIELKFEP